MDAAVWSLVGILAAAVIGLFAAFFYLGHRIDALGASISMRLDGTNARIDSLGERLDARIDALIGKLDAHVEHHA